MKKFLVLFFLPCLLILGTAVIHPVSAADLRSGEEIVIQENTPNLRDLYLFGGAIRVDAPVTNDLVAAGGDININQNVTNSLIVAGGNINLNGDVGNTLRIAGGNIRVNGNVARDLVVTGGSIYVTKEAAIGGDVVFGGGSLVLDGPVKGKVLLEGGDVSINSTINGNVNAEVEKLTLGPNARINGSLTYKATEQAQIASGAVVSGKTNFTPLSESTEEKDKAQEFFTAGAIYKLMADILISILLIYFFAHALTTVLRRMVTKPVESGAIGFTFLFLFPIIALIAFLLIWLGIASLLVYALIFIVSLFVVKIFLGWFILRWWNTRNKKQYILDWKAGIIGPIVLFILAAIPVIGWIAAAILMFIATGALVYELILHMRGQKIVAKKTTPSLRGTK